MLPRMFVVSEAEATPICAAFEQGGELSAAVDLRRLFPAVTDMTEARGVRACHRRLEAAAETAASVPGDRPQREALAFEPGHVPDRPLHLGDRHQGAVLAEPVAEGQDAAQVAPAGPLPLGLGHCGQDGEDQLGHAIARRAAPRSIMCSETPPDLSRPNTS